MTNQENIRNYLIHIEIMCCRVDIAENDTHLLVKKDDNNFYILTEQSERLIHIDEAVEFYINNKTCD